MTTLRHAFEAGRSTIHYHFQTQQFLRHRLYEEPHVEDTPGILSTDITNLFLRPSQPGGRLVEETPPAEAVIGINLEKRLHDPGRDDDT